MSPFPQQHITPAPASDRLFFRYVRMNGPSSRAEIASAMKLSRPTASEAAARLLSRGYLEILTKDKTSTGKPGRVPELYDIPQALGHIITVLCEVDRISVNLYDLHGALLAHREQSTSWEPGVPIDKTIITLLDEVQALAPGTIRAAVISIPTPVNPRTQHMVALPHTGVPHYLIDFHAIVKTHLHCPVYLDENVNWALFSEVHEGVAQGKNYVFGVHLAEYIGSAYAIDSRLYRGAHGTSGQISYMRFGGKPLHQVLHRLGVVDPNSYRSTPNGYLDVAQSVKKIIGHPHTQETARALHILAESVINAAAMIDPAAIVLSGPMIDDPDFAATLLEGLMSRDILGETEILMSADGAGAVRNGARLGAQLLALIHMGLRDHDELGIAPATAG